MVQALRILHVFGVIIWMGGLLSVTTLLRLTASAQSESNKAAGYALGLRLLRAGANPGALVAIVMGVALVIAKPQILYQGWFHAKLFLVLAMLFVHGRLYLRARVMEGDPSYSAASKQFAMLHGVASAILLVILFLVFVRPF